MALYPEMKRWSVQIFPRMESTGKMRNKSKGQDFHTNNGGEYSSKEFESSLKRQGVIHQVTAPHTSVWNGKAEWLHRTLFNGAWAIIAEKKFPSKLWWECIHTAAYLKDQIPTWTLKNKSPYEAYYSQQPDVSHLREIRYHTFMLVQLEQCPKIYDKSIEGILASYSQSSKAYCCYYPKMRWIIITQDVIFIKLKDNYPCPYRPGIVDLNILMYNFTIHMIVLMWSV